MSVLVPDAQAMREIIAANGDFEPDSSDAWFVASIAVGSGRTLRFTLDDGVSWEGQVEHVGHGRITLTTAAVFRHVRVRKIEVVS